MVLTYLNTLGTHGASKKLIFFSLLTLNPLRATRQLLGNLRVAFQVVVGGRGVQVYNMKVCLTNKFTSNFSLFYRNSIFLLYLLMCIKLQ